MNARIPKTLKSVKASVRHEKEKMEMRRRDEMKAKKSAASRRGLAREKKLSLLQDVDKLQKKLRHEENVHRALRRAFTRPLGALPRLPAYLPPYMLELLAEVAVLEEEVVRLEEQVVNFRQGLYEEAVNISSSKKSKQNSDDLHKSFSTVEREEEHCESETVGSEELSVRRHPISLPVNGQGKENQSFGSSAESNKHPSSHKPQMVRTAEKEQQNEYKTAAKSLSPHKLQLEYRVSDNSNEAESRIPAAADERTCRPNGPNTGADSPNSISEGLLKCLSRIFVRMTASKIRHTVEDFPSLPSVQNPGATDFGDPYGICAGAVKRDIGPYKHLLVINSRLINPNQTPDSSILARRLKFLLGKLASVDLKGLSHQEKLAFWINIYNSCMMNAFLQHGMPDSPDMIVGLMRKATINVGGYQLSAITIEHFILRLPYHLKYTFSKGSKSDEMKARSIFGLELSEPLVTFALCCGSWSSPAVRVYTATQVENELEAAKKEYLQAAIAISSTKFVIPKLLDWYLLDFAKDLESLLDWICLQLPNGLGKEALGCLERAKNESLLQFVQIMPYDFNFRYLIKA